MHHTLVVDDWVNNSYEKEQKMAGNTCYSAIASYELVVEDGRVDTTLI
jgi:hypothetical protein